MGCKDETAPDPPPSEPKPGIRPHHLGRSWVRDLAFSVLIAVVLIVFIYQPVKVEGTSMMPALTDQERIFINKFTYRFGIGNIERGDMVVFWFPHDPTQVLHQAGDRVARRHGRDRSRPGVRQRQARWSRATSRKSIATAPPVRRTTVPPDDYFVLGDHRSSSNDSRTWGFVDRKYIYGKAVFVYWPLDKMGRLH